MLWNDYKPHPSLETFSFALCRTLLHPICETKGRFLLNLSFSTKTLVLIVKLIFLNDNFLQLKQM